MNENQESAERNEEKPRVSEGEGSPRSQQDHSAAEPRVEQERSYREEKAQNNENKQNFTPQGENMSSGNDNRTASEPTAGNSRSQSDDTQKSDSQQENTGGRSNRNDRQDDNRNPESRNDSQQSENSGSEGTANKSENRQKDGNERRNERRNPNNRRQNNRRRNPNSRERDPNRISTNENASEETKEAEVKPERTERAPQQERSQNRRERPDRVKRLDRKERDERSQKDDDSTQRPNTSSRSASNERISIVIPLYNEDESIKPLYSQIRRVFENSRRPYEIVFVDDGSTDSSLQKIKEICRMDKRCKYISFQKNYGKSAALQMGFKAATGGIIITMDADLQDDPKEIPNLVRKLDEGWDLVSGWKKKRFDPFIKRFSSKFFNFTTRVISGIKIHDFNCGLKAYRKEAADSIMVYGELHRYMPVLAHWNGFSVTEVEVRHHPRMYGKTKFGISRFFKGFVDLLTVVFLTRYIKRPMHLFGFLGAIATFAGIGVNGYLTYEWLMGQPLSNRPMLFLGMLLIIVGVQFFSTGLLGELMVHNFQSDKEYNIKEKSN